MKNQKDLANTAYQTIPSDGTKSGADISVQNHVAIDDANRAAVNTKATALLTVAQETYQPSSNPTDGDSGILSDSNDCT